MSDATPNLKDLSEILVICTGNVCRSPMAAAALRAKLFERGIDGIRVSSAGTHGGAIPHATHEAILAAEDHGLDLTGHRSRLLTEELADEADLIIAMDHTHVAAVASRWPQYADKCVLLTSFRTDTPKGADVIDPYGAPIDLYRQVFALIDTSLDAFLDRLPS
ncbi:MAG: low molecular weight phosphotyrosine protein phosphatase [Deltaproteobacteria bacterium]|nr:low molecular weight phosphotyrosine protein phosphatase [Deltaproteobacteria bacterium]